MKVKEKSSKKKPQHLPGLKGDLIRIRSRSLRNDYQGSTAEILSGLLLFSS